MNVHTKLSKGIKDMPPLVNYGGCGFTALYLYRALKRRGYDARIVGFDDRKDVLDSLKKPKGTKVPVHFVVKVDKQYYDSEGEVRVAWGYVYTCDEKFKQSTGVEIDEVKLKYLIRHGNWNWVFDRSTCNVVKIIKSIHRTIES